MRTDSLKRLAVLGLSSEQMSVVLDVLAVELAPMERTRELAAQRQQRYVERNSNVRMTSLAQRQDDVIQLSRVLDITSTSKQEVRKKDSPPSPSKPLEPSGFAEFFEAYPKRAGDADRKPAAKAYGAALKRTDSKTLLWAAGRYCADCKAKGTINTEYVKKARTWLNDDGWKEYGNSISEPASVVEIIVLVDTPAWNEWKKIKPNIVPRDIRCPDGRIRQGRYFSTEYPDTNLMRKTG